MNSESKPGPAGGKSRRAFIQKIGTVAAASSVAANASAAQQAAGAGPPGRRGTSNFVPEPGPLSKQPMPTIRLGKHKVGRLVLGINGIGTHFSTCSAGRIASGTRPNSRCRCSSIAKSWASTCRIQTRDQINQYNKEFGGKMLFSCNSDAFAAGQPGDPRKALKKLAANGPIAIHYAASGADDMWRSGQFKKIREWCKMVRDLGVLVCVNGHIPEMFMEMESQGWDVDYYMPALYLFGRTHAEWEKLFQFNPDLAPLEVGQPPTEV